MKFQIFFVVWAIFLLTVNVSSQTPVCHCTLSNNLWLVGSKPIRSNVTIQTTSFSRVFSPKMTSCDLHYDVIYHPPPSILNVWRRGGLTALILRKSRKSCHLRVLQPAWASRVNLSSPKIELETVNLMITSLKTPKSSRRIFLVVGQQFRNNSSSQTRTFEY